MEWERAPGLLAFAAPRFVEANLPRMSASERQERAGVPAIGSFEIFGTHNGYLTLIASAVDATLYQQSRTNAEPVPLSHVKFVISLAFIAPAF